MVALLRGTERHKEAKRTLAICSVNTFCSRGKFGKMSVLRGAKSLYDTLDMTIIAIYIYDTHYYIHTWNSLLQIDMTLITPHIYDTHKYKQISYSLLHTHTHMTLTTYTYVNHYSTEIWDSLLQTDMTLITTHIYDTPYYTKTWHLL